MNYTIIKVTDVPSMKDRAADWFNQKWGIPREVYAESMSDALSGDDAVPEWYIVLDGEPQTSRMYIKKL